MILCLISCSEKIGHEESDVEPEIHLDKPTGLTQVGEGENSVKVSWNAVTNAAEYQYRLTEVMSSTESVSHVLAMGTTSGTYKTIWGLDPYSEMKGIKYYFSVAAVRGKSTSGFCDSIQVIPAGIPPVKITFNADADDFLAFKAGSNACLYDGTNYATYEVQSDGFITTLEVVSEYWPEPDVEYFATIPEVIDGTVIPADYIYTENIFDALPMWASSNTTNLHFKSYLGILAVTVARKEAATLKKLTITGNVDIAGKVISHSDGELPTVAVEGSKDVTISFGSAGIAVGDSGTTVLVPIPAGEYDILYASAVFGDEEPAQIQLKNVRIVSGEKKVVLARYSTDEEEPSVMDSDDIGNDDFYNNAFADEK